MAKCNYDDLQVKTQLVSTTVGAKVLDTTPGYVRQLVAEGKLRGYKVGRLIKVDLNEVKSLLVPINVA